MQYIYSASTINDTNFYKFSTVNFEFCTDSLLEASFCEQDNILNTLNDWTGGIASDLDTFTFFNTETSQNETTTIHGLYSPNGNEATERTFTNVAPFTALTVSFRLWTVDQTGNKNGDITLLINNEAFEIFDLPSDCTVTVDPSTVYNLDDITIENATTVCYLGMIYIEIMYNV